MELRREMREIVETTDHLLGFGSADALALGYPGSLGLTFPHPLDRTVILVRRELYPEPTDWYVVGLGSAADGVVRNSTQAPHEAGQAYQYAACATDGNGYVSAFMAPRRVEMAV